VVLVRVSHLHNSTHHVDLLLVVHVLGLSLSGRVGDRRARLHGEFAGHEADVVNPVLHSDAVLAFALGLSEASGLPNAGAGHAGLVLSSTGFILGFFSLGHKSNDLDLVGRGGDRVQLVALRLAELLGVAPVSGSRLLGNDSVVTDVGLSELSFVRSRFGALGSVDFEAPLASLGLDGQDVGVALLLGSRSRVLVGHVLETHLFGDLLSLDALVHGHVGGIDSGVATALLGCLHFLGESARVVGVRVGSLDLTSENSGLLGLVNGGGVLLVGSGVELSKRKRLAFVLGDLVGFSLLTGEDGGGLLGLERSLLVSPFRLRLPGGSLAVLGGSISFSLSKFASHVSRGQASFGDPLCLAGIVSTSFGSLHCVDSSVAVLFGNLSFAGHLSLLGHLNGESSFSRSGLLLCFSHSAFRSDTFGFGGSQVAFSSLLVGFSNGGRSSGSG